MSSRLRKRAPAIATRNSPTPHAMPPAVLEQFAQNLEQDYAGTIDRFLTLQTAGDDRAVLRRLREIFRHGEPVTAALRAVQDEAQSSYPALGYTVPYAVGNILLTAWGPVIVALMR